jgi:TolB-like protein
MTDSYTPQSQPMQPPYDPPPVVHAVPRRRPTGLILLCVALGILFVLALGGNFLLAIALVRRGVDADRAVDRQAQAEAKWRDADNRLGQVQQNARIAKEQYDENARKLDKSKKLFEARKGLGQIVVFPLEDSQSEDKLLHDFSEKLTASLANIEGLSVKSYTFVQEQAPKTRKDLNRALAQKLNAITYLHGTLIRNGNQSEIYVEAVATDSGAILWSMRAKCAVALDGALLGTDALVAQMVQGISSKFGG